MGFEGRVSVAWLIPCYCPDKRTRLTRCFSPLVGELLLGHKSLDLLRSEAVEAFLYRITAPLQKPGNLITNVMGEAFVKKQERFLQQQEKQQQQQTQKQTTDYDEDKEERNCQEASMCKPSPKSRQPPSPTASIQSKAFGASFWEKGPLAIFTEELCTGMGCQGVEDSPSSTGSSITSPGTRKKYSSRAIGAADTLDIQDSFLEASTIASMRSSEVPDKPEKPTSPLKQQNATWKLAQSTALIISERELVLSYRKTALSTMEKVQVLVEEEEQVGLAWKRFGLALSSLFAYEKEVENARLGDKKIHRDAMPFRRVKKATVDQCVKALIQQKTDRSVPALRLLHSMLTAYVADLSAVSPSVDAYLEAIAQMSSFDEYLTALEKNRQRRGKSLKDGSSTDSTTTSQTSSDDENQNKNLFESFSQRIRSLAAGSRDGEIDKEQAIVRTSSSSSSASGANNGDNELPAPPSENHKRRLVEDRVMANERMLRESLTMLCKSATMRSARMAYTYFKSEAAQCGMLRSSAVSLRCKIDLSDKEAVAQMIARHREENKEDMKTELALAQRIINLGKAKKYPLAGASTKGGKEATEVYTETEEAMSVMRDHTLQVARERVGRWNSDLAMSIMKSVGVKDPNVRVEETTRELRLVRKYAIGLRENLNRCIEAVDLLRKSVLKGNRKDLKGVDKRKSTGRHVSETRKEFFDEAAKLFSGLQLEAPASSPKNARSPQSPRSLPKAGIKLNDPMGWGTPFPELTSKIAQVCVALRRNPSVPVTCHCTNFRLLY